MIQNQQYEVSNNLGWRQKSQGRTRENRERQAKKEANDLGKKKIKREREREKRKEKRSHGGTHTWCFPNSLLKLSTEDSTRSAVKVLVNLKSQDQPLTFFKANNSFSNESFSFSVGYVEYKIMFNNVMRITRKIKIASLMMIHPQNIHKQIE